MKKTSTTVFLVLAISLLARESFSWDYSEYQKKIAGLARGDMWDEFHKNLNSSDKEKAYEAYLLFRPFDNFESRSMFDEFEKKFGELNYPQNDLSMKQDEEEADVILEYLHMSKIRRRDKCQVVFSHSLLDISKIGRTSIDSEIEKTKEMVAETKMCIRSFLKNNATPAQISSKIKDTTGIIFLPVSDYEHYFKKVSEKSWAEFKQAFPDASGYFRFSRVGFDQTFQRAFFQAHVQSRIDAGFGEFVYFEKINGSWKQLSRKGLYIY